MSEKSTRRSIIFVNAAAKAESLLVWNEMSACAARHRSYRREISDRNEILAPRRASVLR